MKDFPSCFGENGVQVADAATKSSQNLVNCLYRCRLMGKCCVISIAWSKNLMGQCLSVEIEIEIDDASQSQSQSQSQSHHCIFKPSLFSKRKGSKCLQVNSSKIEVFWDLCSARFGGGPEPLEGYYVAVVFKGEMILLVGDLRKEALNKTGAIAPLANATFISKREHIFGKRVHSAKVQFTANGRIHDLKIECSSSSSSSSSDDPSLLLHIDAKTVMKVKHLHWKFRGNHTIMVDGLPVHVLWDVHNWFFASCLGSAVFMFSSHPNSQFSFILYAWKND